MTRHLLLPSFALMACCIVCRPAQGHLAQCLDPLFQRFSVAVYRGPVAASPHYGRFAKAKKYRTTIQRGLEAGVNFAGHFVVAKWGCGPNCSGFAMVEASTGEVVFYPKTGVLGYRDFDAVDDPWAVPGGLSFRANSRLLIINPSCVPPDERAALRRHPVFGDISPRYYVWTGHGFEHAGDLSELEVTDGMREP